LRPKEASAAHTMKDVVVTFDDIAAEPQLVKTGFQTVQGIKLPCSTWLFNRKDERNEYTIASAMI